MRFSKAVVRGRVAILILTVLLMIPAVFGMLETRINYDMLNYLPDDMDTVIGQNALLEDFGKGAFSFIVVENMPEKDVAALQEKLESVEHVETVLWYNSLMDTSIPMQLLPDKLYDAFNTGDATMMAVFFDTATSADETMDAIREIRSIAGKQCFVSGMSALVTDLKDLCEQEEPIYVAIAVVLACVAMMVFLDSWFIPFVFLASIGAAILLNLGSNWFMGEISYITKALSAVLQLAVTMDYSIFLWHSYNEQRAIYPDKCEAMAHAISATLTSVVGSSITTIAGFLALCFMSFTLGRDLGIVMAKGVLLGVLSCVTVLPSLILLLDMLEAAKIDGAGRWQTLWHVTIPNVMPSVTICVFLTLTNSFKLFDQNLALTGGSPQIPGTNIYKTEMLALHIFKTNGIGNNWKGVAQAEAVIFFILVAALALLQLRATRTKEVQQ